MIYDPRAILHLMLVEHRWLVLVWFTMFQLIVNATNTITANSIDGAHELSLCVGALEYNRMVTSSLASMIMWGHLGGKESYPGKWRSGSFLIEADECDDDGEHQGPS